MVNDQNLDPDGLVEDEAHKGYEMRGMSIEILMR